MRLSIYFFNMRPYCLHVLSIQHEILYCSLSIQHEAISLLSMQHEALFFLSIQHKAL